MNREELISFIITERVSDVCSVQRSQNPDSYLKEKEYLNSWEKFMKDYPEAFEKTQEFLNHLTETQATAMESCYLTGIKDGVRLMQTIRGLK
ncbi:hypothetical protein [Clostridium transplantifaecale]|uniref:hypothetical protein n=1 Tax=Clostridium transplantifaecale TaxID=2479838 RepID=UPI000F63C416|nr:hypothetical protein [Clostridium transplantifaecale]